MKWAQETLLPVLLLVALFVIGAVVGGAWVTRGKNLEIEKLTRDQAVAEAATAKAALDRLKTAQERADELATKLAEAEAAHAQIEEEKDREIRRLTTGRPCLGAAVVRLLNEPGTGVRLGAMPQASSGFATADGAAASDRDVAVWARTCRARYEICRGRLDALIDYHQGK